jgi:hypothetical protein
MNSNPAKAPSKLRKGYVNTDTNNPVRAPSKLIKGYVSTDTNPCKKLLQS